MDCNGPSRGLFVSVSLPKFHPRKSLIKNDKLTAVSIMGYQEAKKYLEQLMDNVKTQISELGTEWEELLKFASIVIRS